MLYAIAANVRTIPSVLDGLTLAKRKVLYSGLLRKPSMGDMKVCEMVGYVSELTGYRHRASHLSKIIVAMARTDVGTNNINFLEPTRGIFGTRNRGASAVASDPEYLYTQVNKVTRMIFLEKDQHLLSYRSAEGRLVEPTCFFPIVPTILINGASSAGVGFSTYVPPHHVGDIISNLVRLIDMKLTVPMLPFYRGFSGFVEEDEGGGFITRGVWAELDNDTLQITELPVKTSTRKYRQFLCRLCRTGIVKGMEKNDFPLVFVLIFWYSDHLFT